MHAERCSPGECPNEQQQISWLSHPAILSAILFLVSLQPILLMSWRSSSCRRTWRACRWSQDFAPAGRDRRRQTFPTRSTRKSNWAHPQSNFFHVSYRTTLSGFVWYSKQWKKLIYLLFESLCCNVYVIIPSRFAIPHEFLSDDNSESCERLTGLSPLPLRLAGMHQKCYTGIIKLLLIALHVFCRFIFSSLTLKKILVLLQLSFSPFILRVSGHAAAGFRGWPFSCLSLWGPWGSASSRTLPHLQEDQPGWWQVGSHSQTHTQTHRKPYTHLCWPCIWILR